MQIPYFKKPSFKTHFPEEFSLEGLRRVLSRLSRSGGRKIISSALTLYFCLRDSETPTWAKSVILGALGYLVLPLDLIPDAILGVGFTDDWTVILGALSTVITHIKDEHKVRAETLADRFLGGVTTESFEEISLP